MKKLIRLIARISGVEKEIRQENTKLIGSYMSDYSYWFSGLPTAGNSLELYARELKKGNTLLYGGMTDKIRDKVYELDKENKNIHT